MLELVYADICGPITPATPESNRYFLLLVDDFNRKIYVYLLMEKSDAVEVFIEFKALIEGDREKYKNDEDRSRR